MILNFTGACPYPRIVDMLGFLPPPTVSTESLEMVPRYCDCQPVGCGMGALTMDGTGMLGTGLFSGGMDLSTWTWGEWGTIALGLYLLYAVTSTTKTEFRRVSRRIRKRS